MSQMMYGYDIETFPNCFTLSAERLSDGARWFYEISDRRYDYDSVVAWVHSIKHTGGRMVGFNNEAFDYYVLHQIVTGKARSSHDIYKAAMEIIECNSDFPPKVWPSDILVPQIDLYKINHFDNQARRTSLKVLEFNMRSSDIEDLPFDPGTYLTYDQMDTLGKYNIHDVDETMKFLRFNMDKIAFRDELSAQYGKDFTNFNDTKVGKQYFIMKLEETVPGICYNSDKSPRQTPRDQIHLKDAVLPWIEFRTPQFQAVVEWFRDQVITETKGVFTDLPERKLGAVAQYATMRKKRKKVGPKGAPVPGFGRWFEETKSSGAMYECWNQADALNVTIEGFNYVFGVGGIHGSVESQVVTADDEYALIDLDVASYYPNLAITNGFYPDHLGEEFFKIYLDLYEQRKAHPKKKFPAINAMLKLALNGVYGDSNNRYSPFYDPLYTMSITINGQLLLCKLAEDMMIIPQLSMIQINTDGLTVKLPRHALPQMRELCKAWEMLTGLELEEVAYKRMAIRDVNNYIGEYEDGKLKRKGAYAHETPLDNPATGEVEWHKDHSSLVVAKAAEAHLIRGEEISRFIREHYDLYDFMIRAKVDRSSQLVLNDGTTDFPLQRITRYYVTEPPHGGQIVKIMPPLPKAPDKVRRIGQCAGWNVQPCNNINHAMAPINYDYYIQEAEKLCEPLRRA